MAELKTQKTGASVDDFLNGLPSEQTRKDCFELVGIMKQVTQADPQMWGPSIIGFGSTRLKYPNGREIDWMSVAFSPRKQNLTLYLTSDFTTYTDLLEKLGKYKISGGCLHIKKLADVDTSVLTELIQQTVKAAAEK